MTRSLRRAAVAAAAVALATGWAGAAAAATSHLSVTRSDGTAVAPGTAVTADDSLRLAATLDPQTGTSQLLLIQPNGDSATVASGSAGWSNGTTITYTLDTACFTYDPQGNPCSGRSPALNGTWTLQLKGGENESRSLVLRIPPAPVQGVQASAQDTRVNLKWQPGAEPDLRAYDVIDASTGQPLASGLTPSQVCSSSGCATSVQLSSGASGQRSFLIRAERATCPTCSDTLTSDSAPATVTVGAPAPSASSAPAGRTGSTAPSTSSASSSPTGTTSTAAASGSSPGPAAPSSHGGPAAPSGSLDSMINSYLAPPAAAAAPDSPAMVMAPQAQGTFSPELAYPDQTVQVPVQQPLVSRTRAVVLAVTSNHQLWPSLAGALLLLLAAAHLRAWLARTAPGQ